MSKTAHILNSLKHVVFPLFSRNLTYPKTVLPSQVVIIFCLIRIYPGYGGEWSGLTAYLLFLSKIHSPSFLSQCSISFKAVVPNLFSTMDWFRGRQLFPAPYGERL